MLKYVGHCPLVSIIIIIMTIKRTCEQPCKRGRNSDIAIPSRAALASKENIKREIWLGAQSNHQNKRETVVVAYKDTQG